MAAAAWVGTVAQATTLTLVAVLLSWAIDASDGFAALAWLGRAADWSVTTQLAPFEHGVLRLGSVLWLLALTVGCLGVACLGARFDVAWPVRLSLAAAVTLATVAALSGASTFRQAWDATELRRGSLPPAAVAGLRRLHSPISLVVWLDRDDARRRQLETDVIAKLEIARPDLVVRNPLDNREAPAGGVHDDANYGRIEACVAGHCLETYSTSRQELVRQLFSAARQPLPDWSQPSYAGYPRIIEGRKRSLVAAFAYLLVPGALALFGILLTRPKRRFS
jgi:hypothetical protein